MRATVRTNDRSPRLIGALLALLLWTPMAAFVLWSGDSRGVALGLAGLLVSPVVGGILAPRAVASRGLGYATAGWFALIAVLTGSLVSGVIFAILASYDPSNAVGYALIGLIVLGIPLGLIGFNLALVWVALVRRFAARTRVPS